MIVMVPVSSGTTPSAHTWLFESLHTRAFVPGLEVPQTDEPTAHVRPVEAVALIPRSLAHIWGRPLHAELPKGSRAALQ
jgi:hypothetical protein